MRETPGGKEPSRAFWLIVVREIEVGPGNHRACVGSSRWRESTRARLTPDHRSDGEYHIVDREAVRRLSKNSQRWTSGTGVATSFAKTSVPVTRAKASTRACNPAASPPS